MSTTHEAGQTVLRGGRVFDTSTGLLRAADVRIADGRIAEVGADLKSAPGARELDVAGRVIVPGLINVHTHLLSQRAWGAGWRQSMLSDPVMLVRGVRHAMRELKHGVLTVRDMGARNSLNVLLKRLIQTRAVPGPRLFTSADPISVTGGYGGAGGNEANGSEGMRAAVRQRAADGADVIKLFTSNDPTRKQRNNQYSRPEFTAAEVSAATEAAHDRGLRVGAHAMGTTSIQRAIDAGVDSIEHGIYLKKDQARQMADAGIALVLTLSTYKQNTDPKWDRGRDWEELMKKLVDPGHREATEIALEAGVPIGVGTDSIGNIIEELQMLKAYGMKPGDALVAATAGNAKILGLDDMIGSVSKGMVADLIVIDGDPLSDFENLRRIEWIFQEGVAMRPAEITLSAEDETAEWNTLSLLVPRLGSHIVQVDPLDIEGLPVTRGD
jgi:imidazolonepropionase-like amidohydrolase